ncbi:MAG: HPr(Ser) kinase/phosphatase [Mycoplasmataceae bacterium]|jgi:HPr kinase/phosphorylase|nr:HPr(Ser) kinase/phosphatase [Mycoplasmataceae bacterium]
MSKQKSISVKSLIKKFNFEVLCKGSSRNKILIPSLNRTGVELASKHIVFENIISAVLWSGNESKFLSQLTKKKMLESMDNVLRLKPPVIIITKAFKQTDQLLRLAKKYSTTIIFSAMPSAQLYVTVAQWINEQMAEYTTIHGTLVSVYGVGVLLQGESGVGKSEVALELVRKGHLFIADDAVDVTNLADRLYGRPNAIANKFIEVRGLGILNIPRMLGIEKTQDSSIIDVVIELMLDDKKTLQFERLGDHLKTKGLEKVQVPYYKLPITPGRKMSDLIETAVIDLKLKQHGYSSAKDYMDNYKKVNRKNV